MRVATALLPAISLLACAPTTVAVDGAGESSQPPGRVIAGSSYRITGDGSVRPVSVSDDGAQMAIVWSRAQAIPAVFAVSDQGQEEAVNGYMRNDIYVIDRIYGELLFRIDKAQAKARRSRVRRR